MNRSLAALCLVTLAAPVSLAQDAEDERIAGVLATEVSLRFLETPLPRALESIQDAHPIQFVLDPGAGQPSVTLDVEGATLDEALRRMLAPHGLAHVVEDGVIFVTERSTLERRRVEVRSYPVLDLVQPTLDYPGPRIGLGAVIEDSGGQVGMGAIFAADEGIEAFTIEELEDYLRSTIEPETWDLEGYGIFPVGSRMLVVSQTPEVHAAIEEVLGEMRALGERQVDVEGRWYAVPRADLAAVTGDPAARTVLLDGPARQRLAERGRLLDQLTLRCDNTQRVHGASTRTVAHVRDYDVSLAQSSVSFDPIVGILSEGMVLDVRPVLAPGGGRIAVEVRSRLVRFAGAPRDVPATVGAASATTGEGGTTPGVVVGGGGWLEAVDGREAHVQTQVRVPDGKGAAFVSSSPIAGEGEVLVFLLVPGAVE